MQVYSPVRVYDGRTVQWRIYVLQNTVVNRWYVGQTSGGIARIKSHFKKSTANAILWHDVEVHGVKSFRYRFLETATLYTKEMATMRELIEIVKRDTIFPRGYNRNVETTSEMTGKTWEALRQLADKPHKFYDEGKMLPIPCLK